MVVFLYLHFLANAINLLKQVKLMQILSSAVPFFGGVFKTWNDEMAKRRTGEMTKW